MINSLIERWREARESYVALNMKCVGTEMAHEIKRLRAALYDVLSGKADGCHECSRHEQIAREALKDD